MSTCCSSSHHSQFDPLLWAGSTIVAVSYLAAYFLPAIATVNPKLGTFNATIFEFFNIMVWGLLLGIIAVGLLNHIPRQSIMNLLGHGGTLKGLLRACLAGLLLDLCSHGILLVGTKLYERGASLGQVMAFLIASPWNSFSLTFILIALIGLPWTLTFIGLSFIIALISGAIFDKLVARGKLPKNPHNLIELENEKIGKLENKPCQAEQPVLSLSKGSRSLIRHPSTTLGMTHIFTFSNWHICSLLKSGYRDSKSILRWIWLGLILVALIRTFISTATFHTFFGPTLAGLAATMAFATIIEVCSEGSLPIAADLFTRAKAPGNAFAFLMAGVSTDYTEIAALKQTTRSWPVALLLPLVTLPQIAVMAIVINNL